MESETQAECRYRIALTLFGEEPKYWKQGRDVSKNKSGIIGLEFVRFPV